MSVVPLHLFRTNTMNRHSCRTAAAARSFAVLALLSLGLPLQAMENTFSGFGTVAAGRTFGGCVDGTAMAPSYSAHCTRYIADWAHAGVYTPEWSASEESRIGLQWTGAFTDSLSATAQAVGRLNVGQKVGLEWAYLTYKINPSWSVQLGRKRLPLYYYSDFQDIGYAYTSIRPSPDVYGWDVVNYNGGNVDYTTDVGDWSLRGSVFAGSETSRKNAYTTLIYDELKDVKWDGIAGAWLEVNHDWFTARVSYTESIFQQIDRATGEVDELYFGRFKGHQRFYGVALNADYDDWIARSEFAAADRSTQGYKAKYFFVTVGHRIGDFTPAATLSAYLEKSTVPDYDGVRNRTASFSLRYEVNKSSALKVQLDRDIDSSSVPYTGTAKAVAVSYDFVF